MIALIPKSAVQICYKNKIITQLLFSLHSTIGGVEEKAGHTYVNPNNAQYAHDSDCLYEVGGNIGKDENYSHPL